MGGDPWFVLLPFPTVPFLLSRIFDKAFLFLYYYLIILFSVAVTLLPIAEFFVLCPS